MARFAGLLKYSETSIVHYQIFYLLKTIWLFTYSDLKTIIGPQSAFGTLTALAAHVFEQPALSSPSARSIVLRLPVTIAWTYLNLLPFNISNQRHYSAVQEDALNKPWRPLPSGRLSPSQAQWLMIASYFVAIVGNIYIGGLKQCVALIVLGFCYNDAGGADGSWVTRNLINACGFISFASGATEVALGHKLVWTRPLLQWFVLITLIIFSTIQTQDMFDTEGDKLKGRSTIPLVIGDSQARLSIAVPVVAFALFCPWFWGVPVGLYLVPATLGCAVAVRILYFRNVEADKSTFRLWNVWLVSLYSLPVLKYSIGV